MILVIIALAFLFIFLFATLMLYLVCRAASIDPEEFDLEGLEEREPEEEKDNQ